MGLCERFHCLPRAGGLLDQDADFMRMLQLEAMARPDDNVDEEVLDDE